ncbi:hypothetical protein D779_2016 [Imhoffiella purpurea]|uniref:NAD-specific glutamate dehydrogenase n=1 Tax=Imhoffiella purpurea TaxID=1249627 RepID=W9VDA2_9GAMM|nr:hypothetical protein D779_2016 [Imhoffiella purpurea]
MGRRLRFGRRGQIVAGLDLGLLGGVLGTNALDLIVGRLHVLVRQQQDLDLLAVLDVEDGAALLVEQEGRDAHRQLGQDALGVVLHRLLFEDAQDRQCQGLDAADGAAALAARADLLARLAERGTQTLARHLQQPEARDAGDLNPCPVLLERLAQPVLDLSLVLGRGHVDEVDDEETAEVAQTQLAGDLVGRLQIGVERRLLDVRALGRARRVDVDRGQGFGVVDDDGAARGQAHLALEGGLDLGLDLIAGEERDLVLVETQLLLVLRHHLLDEVLGSIVDRSVVDHDLADVRAQIVADRADDDVALLVDEEGGLAALAGGDDGAPQLEQIVEVPLEFLDVFADARGAYDEPHVLRDLELTHGVAQLAAVLSLDAARDAAGARIVGHEDQIASGQRDEGGQGGALVAALLLVDLDHDLAALAHRLLDVGARSRLDTVGLEIGARDLLEREETVALGSIIDEGGLQAGLDPGDDALVDVGLLLLAAG